MISRCEAAGAAEQPRKGNPPKGIAAGPAFAWLQCEQRFNCHHCFDGALSRLTDLKKRDGFETP